MTSDTNIPYRHCEEAKGRRSNLLKPRIDRAALAGKRLLRYARNDATLRPCEDGAARRGNLLKPRIDRAALAGKRLLRYARNDDLLLGRDGAVTRPREARA